MNKLVSKNPIQRFKQGKKIVRAQYGFKTRDDGVIVNSAGTPVGKSIRGSSYEYEKMFPKDKLILPGLYQEYGPENSFSLYSPNNMTSDGYYIQIMSGRQPSIQNGTYYETKDASGKVIERGRYFGGKKHPLPLGNISKSYEVSNSKPKQTAIAKQSTPPPSIPINNVWLKGYKHNEVNDVKAMQNELIKLGLLKGNLKNGTGADGKWGKNTEAAYQKYLSLKNIPVYEKPETPSVAAMAGIYSEENKPLYQRIRFKQGGQLISRRNPIERFKNKINKN